jgi:hypothetical protein
MFFGKRADNVKGPAGTSRSPVLVCEIGAVLLWSAATNGVKFTHFQPPPSFAPSAPRRFDQLRKNQSQSKSIKADRGHWRSGKTVVGDLWRVLNGNPAAAPEWP